MLKFIVPIMVIPTLVIAVAACSPPHRMAHKAPGSYQSSTSSTDASGTTTVKQQSSEVSIDSDGHRKETNTVKTTTDPRGLGNKTTSQTTSTSKE